MAREHEGRPGGQEAGTRRPGRRATGETASSMTLAATASSQDNDGRDTEAQPAGQQVDEKTTRDGRIEGT